MNSHHHQHHHDQRHHSQRQNHNHYDQSQSKQKKSLTETIMVVAGVACIIIMFVQMYVHVDLHDKHSFLRHHNDNDDDRISGIIDLDGNVKIGYGDGYGNGNANVGNDDRSANNPDLFMLFHNADGNGDSDNADGESNGNANANADNAADNTADNAPDNNDKDIIDCGCPSTCTKDALETHNSNFKCISRIRNLMNRYKSTQREACTAASKSSIHDMDEEEIRPCPLYCNPNICETISTTTELNSLKKQIQIKEQEEKEHRIDCGCPETCTKRALQKRNPNFLCLERIQHLMKKYDVPELEACETASQTSFALSSTDLLNNVDVNLNKPCEYECHPKLCKSTKVPDEVIDTLNLPKSFTASSTTYRNSTHAIHAIHATNTTNTTNTNTTQSSFHKYDKVVIVTKVLSSSSIDTLIQMLCLFHAAYNRFVHYDIIVFTTIPFTDDQIQTVRDIVAPSNLEVVTEGPSLEDHLNNMTESERNDLYRRCHVNVNSTVPVNVTDQQTKTIQQNETSGMDITNGITWSHHCEEENSPHVFNLGYAWQAEFRSYHLWTHPALENYKYMMWLDADAMCTKTWEVDPVRVMVENDLILMFDQFPGGYVRGEVLRQKMEAAYGNGNENGNENGSSSNISSNINGTAGVICKVELDEERGVLTREFCKDDGKRLAVPSIRQVYGFHHITNLNVYRQENHQRFLKGLITNDYKFSRLWDDQLAVTLPAVMEDPERCWDYRLHGLNMGIQHNGRIDGKEHPEYLSYVNFWAHHGKYDWPAARAMCDGLVTSIG